MGRSRAVLAAALAATLIAGCTPASGNDPVAGAAAPAASGARGVTTLAEAFLTPMTPADNID
ncbi:phytase, partial [Mesorhizobium sp. M8A.F.Ca.ET.207.01.1.1]